MTLRVAEDCKDQLNLRIAVLRAGRDRRELIAGGAGISRECQACMWIA